MNKQEMDVIVLAAGQQKRFGQHESKMMAKINDRPAFGYTMDTLLTSFPQDRINIITSTRFPDLNNYITDTYPQSKILLDDAPGKGTAHTLSKSFPWHSEKVLVTDADIYYEPELIEDHIKILRHAPDTQAIVTATSHVDAAPSHRGMDITPQVTIFDKANQPLNPKYRNAGVHTIGRAIQNHWDGETKNLIDVLKKMQESDEPVAGYAYQSTYLHMATREDVPKWQDHFSSNKRHKSS